MREGRVVWDWLARGTGKAQGWGRRRGLGGAVLAPDSREGFQDLSGDPHAHPLGRGRSRPSYSGDHFDPKIFAQLFQEDKGEDGVRNEPDGSRNESLEGESENEESARAQPWASPSEPRVPSSPTHGERDELASAGLRLAGHAARAPRSWGLVAGRDCRSGEGGTTAIAVHAELSIMHQPLCPQTHQCRHHHHVGRISAEARVRSHNPGSDGGWTLPGEDEQTGCNRENA